MERRENRIAEVTVTYSCGGCTYFKGETKEPLSDQADVAESIAKVWTEHNRVMHNGAGSLNIHFTK